PSPTTGSISPVFGIGRRMICWRAMPADASLGSRSRAAPAASNPRRRNPRRVRSWSARSPRHWGTIASTLLLPEGVGQEERYRTDYLGAQPDDGRGDR